MTKPHEENWMLNYKRSECRNPEIYCGLELVATIHPRPNASSWTDEVMTNGEASAKLILAVPALVRALLREIRQPKPGEYHIHSCIMERRGIPGECIAECREAIGALKMAGALE